MNLPEVLFAEKDPSVILQNVLASYENQTGRTLYPGDPVTLLLKSLSYVLAVQNSMIDLAAKQNLLAYATGAHLDHLGDLMGVKRIEAQPARCSMEFHLSGAMDFEVAIPAGTRVATKDGKVIFRTSGTVSIAAGKLSAVVPALATDAGTAANGLMAGQVSLMLDSLPYVASARNVTQTQEGADEEGDERFRERIRLAPESYSCAGSEGAYRAHVLAVSPDIEEVVIHSPVAGTVDVRFVLAGGELPDEAMVSLVKEAISGETVRPLTDTVTVSAPDTVPYSVKGQWFLGKSNAVLLSSVTQAVGEALETYRLWQRAKPGRDINPTKLISLVEQAGAKRIELDSPSFTTLGNVQVARELSLELTFGGLEDD